MTTKKVREPAEARDASAAEERAAAAAAPATPDAAPEPPEVGDPKGAAPHDAIDDTPTSADYSTAFSPRNVAVGLAIVAGLVAFAASRRRRKTAGREDS